MNAKTCFVRLRVTREPPGRINGVSFGVVPDYRDVHVEIVAEDGTVFECPDIRGVSLDWKDSDRNPLEVTLRVMPGEVDVDVFAKFEEQSEEAPKTEDSP